MTLLAEAYMALLNLRHGNGYGTSHGPVVSAPVKSLASIVAILAAVGSFFFVDNAAAKMVLAILAVVFGVIGMLRAASPRVSGGILSLVAIAIAIIGFLAAILDTIGLF